MSRALTALLHLAVVDPRIGWTVNTPDGSICAICVGLAQEPIE
ncbi:hypothetical protein [Sporichthya sp.]|nr:hypothetical protein [Sporichthya sp.]